MKTATTTPLKERLRDTATIWAQSQHELVVLAAEFADSGEWLPFAPLTNRVDRFAHNIAPGQALDLPTSRHRQLENGSGSVVVFGRFPRPRTRSPAATCPTPRCAR